MVVDILSNTIFVFTYLILVFGLNIFNVEVHQLDLIQKHIDKIKIKL